MKVAIHQPNYLPWLGFFYKLSLVDVFVFLDNVQFSKNSYQNRTEIKTPQGKQWLTVPVLTKGRAGQLTNTMCINNNIDWRKTHWKTILQNYHKAPSFDLLSDILKKVYSQKRDLLVELNEYLIAELCGILGVQVKLVKASDLGVGGESTELLLNICRALNATVYLSGPSGRKYMDLALFERRGVKIAFTEFNCPIYPQIGKDFVPNLSIIDLVANCGDRSLEILRGDKQ